MDLQMRVIQTIQSRTAEQNAEVFMGYERQISELESQLDTLRQQNAELMRERDAMAAALVKRKTCSKCGGTGRYLAYPPTIYCTDTKDEMDDAHRMAERKCPDCGVDPKAILAAHDAEVTKPLVEALEEIPCSCKPMGCIEVCPQCGAGLRAVRNPPNSLLNDGQFDSIRAGDYYCENCKGTEAKSGHKYWWKSDLEKQPKRPCIRCEALAPYRKGGA